MPHEEQTDSRPLSSLLRHCRERINGLNYHWVEVGKGPTVLLLHGFPEFWYAWRHQLPTLASAGFRAVAPDLRGYNDTDKPKGIAAYRANVIAQDISLLIDRLGEQRVYLVGHDWGGTIAFRVASLFPQKVRKLAILNGPHPAARQDVLRRRPWLWLRSLYMFLFRMPRLAESLLHAGDFALFERMWRTHPTHSSAYTPEEIAAYKDVFRRADGLTGPLNYYRAAFRYPQDLLDPPQEVTAPTRILWADRDPYLPFAVIEPVSRWVPDVHITRFPDASHWIQNDIPDRVNQELVAFFRA